MGSSSKQQDQDVKREVPLQAVVFADSFAQTFRPVTLDVPKVLLPLLSIPILEYTLEFLAASGVKEVIVFCVAHAEAIEHFLKTANRAKIMDSIQCVCSAACLSPGDALRELDRMHLIRSDPFILMSGDNVSNINLRPHIQLHKERKKKEPSTVMTLLLKQSQPIHASRSLQEDLVVAVDPQNQELLMYSDEISTRRVSLSTEVFRDHPSVTFHYDWFDCHIDICSPDVLVQFSDNFDYQDIRRDFVANEVQNYELGSKIYAVPIPRHEYAGRIVDPRTYHAVVMDLCQRWVYPIVPDNNIFITPTTYTYDRNNIYKEQLRVSIARSTHLKQDCVLGSDTRIGEHGRVSQSSFGRHVSVGASCSVVRCHLWNHVTMGDHVSMTDVICCDHVTIGNHVTIGSGSILSYGVKIGDHVTIPPFSKITTQPRHAVEDDEFGSSNDEDEDENDDHLEEAGCWKVEEVGVGGQGRMWLLNEEHLGQDHDLEEEEDSDSDDDEMRHEINDAKRTLAREGRVQRTLMGSSAERLKREQLWEEWDALSSDDEDHDEEEEGQALETPEERFQRVVMDMVLSGHTSGHDLDNIFLEIKSFKFAQNRSFTECLEAIVPALLSTVSSEISMIEQVTVLQAALTRWASVIKRCIMGTSEQLVILNAIKRHAVEHFEQFNPVFRYCLQMVYDLEIVSEDMLVQWVVAAQHEASENLTGSDKELMDNPQIQEFIDWLQEEEDSSEEEGDE